MRPRIAAAWVDAITVHCGRSCTGLTWLIQATVNRQNRVRSNAVAALSVRNMNRGAQPIKLERVRRDRTYWPYVLRSQGSQHEGVAIIQAANSSKVSATPEQQGFYLGWTCNTLPAVFKIN